MPRPRFQDVIIALSFPQKLLLAGSTLMAISLFLPWYQDIDQFKTGDMFLGISGPMYLIGFTLLLLVIANVSLLFMETTGKALPVPVKPAHFYMASGLVSFYFLILVNSIYFHQKFGVNITIKQSDFGVFFAFVAASLMTIGGYLASRDKVALLKEFQKETQASPFIMPQAEVRKPKENLRSSVAAKPVYQNLSQMPIDTEAKKIKSTYQDMPQMPMNAQPEKEKVAPQAFRTDL